VRRIRKRNGRVLESTTSGRTFSPTCAVSWLVFGYVVVPNGKLWQTERPLLRKSLGWIVKA